MILEDELLISRVTNISNTSVYNRAGLTSVECPPANMDKDKRKVQSCNNIHITFTWTIRIMKQGKLDVRAECQD